MNEQLADHAPMADAGAQPTSFAVQSCTRGETVARAAAIWAGRPLTDPFSSQLVVVPGPGHARWLSQQIAHTHGITAGIEFLTLRQLHRRLRAVAGADDVDPWALDPLTLTLAELLHDVVDQPASSPWADDLRAHLMPQRDGQEQARPGRAWSVARRVAGLFRRYCLIEPDLIDQWSAGNPFTASGDPLPPGTAWQFELWQQCQAAIGDNHPVAQERALVRSLEAGLELPWERGFVAAFEPLTSGDQRLVRGLSASIDLDVMQLATRLNWAEGGSIVEPLHRVSDAALAGWARLGTLTIADETPAAPGNDPDVASGQESASMLHRFQRALTGERGLPGAADLSVQVLASHGPNRQVEVLREALCGMFEDDPTLEPRDVVIVCPDPSRHAPMLQAALGVRDEPDAHPGHRLRVQVPGSGPSAGPVHDVLAHLFSVSWGRATAEDLNTLVALEPVSRRFGFSTEDRERIRSLLDKARVRWGLDTGTRTRLGVGAVGQGTWLNGIERLVTGATFADAPLVWQGTALPIPDVEAQDLRVIGSLAELVSRVRRLAHEFATDATAEQWSRRLLAAIGDFVEVPWDQQWTITQTSAQVRAWAEGAGSATLSQADVRQMVQTMSENWTPRPAFGNGSLQVVGLGDLRGVPHRVVAVLGLDDQSFPLRPRTIGDDLLRSLPEPSDPEKAVAERTDHLEHDARARSQGALAAALLAARERVVIVHQGSDQRTGAAVDPPVAITQLTTLLHQVAPEFRVRTMPLQPHTALNFLPDPATGEEPFSFDAHAFEASRALATADHRRGSDHDARRWSFSAPVPPAVALGDLTSFWRHPVRAMLRNAVGTSLRRTRSTPSLQVPVEVFGFGEYQIGDAALQHFLAGASQSDVEAALRLGGDVPPGRLGDRPVQNAVANARQLAEIAHGVPGHDTDVPITLELGIWQLTGVVRLRGDVLFDVTYARLNGASQLDLWIQLLAVSLQLRRSLRARRVHVDQRHGHLQAPALAVCRDILIDLLEWRALGLESALLAPVKLLHQYHQLSGQHMGGHHLPDDERRALEKARDREFRALGKDADWAPFMPASLPELLASPAHRRVSTTVKDLGAALFSPIDKAQVSHES